MKCLQLDAESVAARVQASGRPAEIPSLASSLGRGIIGFTIVSIAGFAPWAIGGRWFSKNLGEAGLYGVCALVFIAASGLLLHGLIIGPGSLVRFYKLFSLAFAAYSVAWMAGWMTLRGYPGSIAGLLAGTILMGLLLTWAFNVRAQALQVIAALFLLNSAGYFIGGWVEAGVGSLGGTSLTRSTQLVLAKSLWGVCYGLGFGAGLGLAFYLCQNKTRAFLKTRPTSQ
jgi:hypothetical protein